MSKTDGTIIEFLDGAKSYEGVWFGEKHPTRGGTFWWRKILLDYHAQFQQPAVTSMQWIKAKERTPEPNTYYHVRTPFGIDAGKYSPGSKVFTTRSGDRFNPIDVEWLDESVPVQGEVYRWVKASERLPDEEDNYFVKVDGIEHDNDNAEYSCGAYHHFVNTFEGKSFSSLPDHETVVEWLEQIPPTQGQEQDSIQCKCKEEDKHGETSIMCCNECGLPTEKFWERGTPPIIAVRRAGVKIN